MKEPDPDKMVRLFDDVGDNLLAWLKAKTKMLDLTEEERFLFSSGVCLTVGAAIAGIHDRAKGFDPKSQVRLVKKIYRLAYEGGV